MTKKLIVVLILIFAFSLRFWNVWSNPAGLYYDEIDAGFQARSLLQTGLDYRGDFSFFYINSFLDPRPPIPVYLTALSTILFANPELQVRMGQVILGTINVGLIFWLLYKLSKNYWLGVIGTIVSATNPWWIQFSRYNHEAHTSVFFPILGIIVFLYGLEKKKFRYFILSTILIALSIYTYRTMSLLTPLIFFSIIISFFSKIKTVVTFKQAFLLIFLFVFITLSMVFSTTFFAKDKPRIAQIAIFVDQATPIVIQRERETDSGDISDSTIGKQTTFFSKIFHNKAESYLSVFFKNYFSAYSTDFLFVKGDKNHRHSIDGQGMLFYTDIILIGFGIYFLFKNRSDPGSVLILLLFFLSPIPSSLTQDGDAHAARMFLYSLPLLLVISYGWLFFFKSVKNINHGKQIIATLLACHLLLFIFYVHDYQFHFKIESGRWHGYPYKEAIQKIMTYQKDFDHIVMVPHPDPPNLYLLFWGNFSPKDAQDFGTNYNEPKNDGSLLDKFKIVDLPRNTADLIKSLQPNTLYLVTQDELQEDLRDHKKPPTGIDLLDIITYPDKEIAFYLIKKSDIVEK